MPKVISIENDNYDFHINIIVTAQVKLHETNKNYVKIYKVVCISIERRHLIKHF